MKKIMNLIALFVLSFATMTASFATSANAAELGGVNKSNLNETSYTVDDILALEPYIFVENGLFKINAKKAIINGVDLALIDGQQEYFNVLNQEVKDKTLIVNQDLSIKELNVSQDTPLKKNPSDVSALATCKGKTIGPKKYWWGYTSYANSCDTKKLISNANTVAASGAISTAGLGGLGIFFPALLVPGAVAGVTSGYFCLFATRLEANNKGKGVIVDMTWATAYNLKSQ